MEEAASKTPLLKDLSGSRKPSIESDGRGIADTFDVNLV